MNAAGRSIGIIPGASRQPCRQRRACWTKGRWTTCNTPVHTCSQHIPEQSKQETTGQRVGRPYTYRRSTTGDSLLVDFDRNGGMGLRSSSKNGCPTPVQEAKRRNDRGQRENALHANTQCGDVAFLHAIVERVLVDPSIGTKQVRPDVAKAVARSASTEVSVTRRARQYLGLGDVVT
eukprot:COSAG02_NODE_4731_length_5043_cov_3.579895_5_plen_177_part_00